MCRRESKKNMAPLWQKVYDANYHKSLDHRSFYFKQTDKRLLGAKGMVADIRGASLFLCNTLIILFERQLSPDCQANKESHTGREPFVGCGHLFLCGMRSQPDASNDHRDCGAAAAGGRRPGGGVGCRGLLCAPACRHHLRLLRAQRARGEPAAGRFDDDFSFAKQQRCLQVGLAPSDNAPGLI